MSKIMVEILSVAAHWRQQNHEYEGGVVLIWQGKAYGWKDRLRDPHCERPGVYAVDAEGHIFITDGGDDVYGAKCWVAT